MLEKAKLEKIKSFNNDDSDLVLVFDKYIEREIPYSNENVYGEPDKLIENLEKECLYIVFTNKNIEIENAYKVKLKTTKEKILESEYRTGNKYIHQLKELTKDKDIVYFHIEVLDENGVMHICPGQLLRTPDVQ